MIQMTYLKNLLYEKDIISVAELKNNYRNTKKIEEILEVISNLNIEQFGTHNFVLKGSAIESNIKTNAIYIPDGDFLKEVAKGKYDNFTIVVQSAKEKEVLRKFITAQEILTVSEIKGLERDTVVLFDILSTNIDKWSMLNRILINKKQADENSVYIYYFNSFYVAVSRARQNLFVVENKKVELFENLFKTQFESLGTKSAIEKLNQIVSKFEFSENELVDRIAEFIRLGQYDNARFTANKILDDELRIRELNRIYVNEQFISSGNYRDAGIAFWELNMLNEAKEQFVLSKDDSLIELIDACEKNNDSGLNIDIVKYLPVVKENEIAVKLIMDTVQKDLDSLKSSFKNINENFKKGKEKSNGK
jgi:hypothetical protein